MPFQTRQFGLKTSDVVGFTESQRLATEMQVTISIANEASWLYKNFKLPRFRNSYGFCQVMSGAFVVREVQLQYLNQEILQWRATEFGTNDVVICTGKALALLLPTPGLIVGNVVPTRQRYTSIRVRLYPGVEANIGLNWETPSSNCNNNIPAPEQGQGNPIAPNNGSADPGSRPADQGEDEVDGSPNDGNDLPNDGKPDPPKAGDGSNFPHWHALLNLRVPPGCVLTSSIEDFPDANNPNIRPVYTTDRQSACPGTTGGDITYSGALLSSPRDVVSCSFRFY